MTLLKVVFWPDHLVIGGGNAKHLKELPNGVERGENQDAFRGALRLWPGSDMLAEVQASTWRIKRTTKEKTTKDKAKKTRAK